MPIITAPLDHVGLVVRDVETIARGYAELLDVNVWNLVAIEDVATGATVHGQPTALAGRLAVGTTPWGDDFWLIEPAGGRSTYKDFQATNRHGVHHLGFRLTRAEADAAVEAFRKLDAPLVQSYAVEGLGTVLEVDTRKLLGGFYVQLVGVEAEAASENRLPAGRTLDLSSTYTRPDGIDALPVPAGIQHFGVVVRDLVERTAAFTTVFGVPEWSVMNWRTEKGSLEDPTFDGKPVDHEYFAATTPYGSAVGFEVVQPTLGPSDYKENFLQIVGEGIHHLNLVGLADHDHWLKLRAWFEAIGIKVCMSGTLGGGIAEFYYIDTRSKLGGIAVECFGLDPTVDLTTVENKGPYYTISSASQSNAER